MFQKFNPKKIPIRFLFVIFLLPFSVEARLPKYSQIDDKLKTAWEKSYPVAFTKIIRKDVEGKGILHLRSKKNGERFIYTFLVFVPRYRYEENTLLPEKEGREIFVKLFYQPDNKEEPYSIHLGEFDEKYDTKSIVNWIKN
ncbi:MAG: hypothetical protein K8R21_01105 [Leptospira sp.]|nr:hypothetical protein [Leptospira sp.]